MDALRGRQESLESADRLGWLAEDFPDHPTQVGAQFPGAGPGPLHLPGVGVATLLHEQSGTDSFVALLDLDPALPRLFHQTLPPTVVEPGIGRVAHRFGLHRRIHIDPLELGGRDHLHPQSGVDRFLEHRFRASFAEAVAPPRHAGGINRHLVLEKLFAAEVLPVGILNPLLHDRFVAEVVLILEIVQRHQQTRAHSGRSVRCRIRLTQPFSENFPVNLPPQLHQRMPGIHELLQLHSEKSPRRLVDQGFGLHQFSRIYGLE